MVVVAVAVVGKPMGNTHQPIHIPIPTWVGTDPWWVWVWVGLRVPMGIPMLFPNSLSMRSMAGITDVRLGIKNASCSFIAFIVVMYVLPCEK